MMASRSRRAKRKARKRIARARRLHAQIDARHRAGLHHRRPRAPEAD